MTIRRGQTWGEPGSLAPGAPLIDRDADLVPSVADRLEEGGPSDRGRPEVGLLGGDLHRTLGSPQHTADELRSGEGMRFPVDLVEVTLHPIEGGSVQWWFCAHLIAVEGRSRPFESPTYVAMNGNYLGELDLGPRAHPGDGLVDVTEGRLPRKDRRAARLRYLTGTHLPHPALRTRRVGADEVTFDRPMSVRLDGGSARQVTALELRCVPDALTVVV